MKVIFEGLQPEPAIKAETQPQAPARRRLRVQLQPVQAPTRLFHAFYA